MELFDEAVCFATERHSGQRRRTSSAPYILHPLEAATIVATMTEKQEVICAAVLHDTVEDAGVTFDEIRERFGDRVTALVASETEDKRVERPAIETWLVRKEESLQVLEYTDDIEVKMLWLGDKLSNMRSYYREYRKVGNAFWQNFNQKDPVEQAWYYRELAKLLSDLKDYDAYKEYVSLMDVVFESVGKEEGEEGHEKQL